MSEFKKPDNIKRIAGIEPEAVFDRGAPGYHDLMYRYRAASMLINAAGECEPSDCFACPEPKDTMCDRYEDLRVELAVLAYEAARGEVVPAEVPVLLPARNTRFAD